MIFSVQYAEEFEIDLQEIIDWYEDQSIDLDRKFVESLKIATSQTCCQSTYLSFKNQWSKI